MKKIILIVALSAFSFSLLFSQSFTWETTKDGIFRDGESFFLNGESWAKKTKFTYGQGTNAEENVMKTLTELHEIGVNAIRIYGSPDESDWDGSSNFDNLIKWIEEWNVANPDGGDPNKAMYYIIQFSPKDPQSALDGNLPENSTASFNRAINDQSNDGSVRNMINYIDEITNGSKYLLAYLIYHELNVSSKYSNWFDSVGASGIENFMNNVADAIHSNYAPGKLVAHTGDAKDLSNGIYKSIEALDNVNGNVFAKFDMIGFNLYISSDGLLDKDQYYTRIVNRRALSVNDKRGWFIGETGASYDLYADPNSVAAANYTNTQGGANLQIMWQLCKELGNMNGFMLFTVQDNDKQETYLDGMKQRGFYDYYFSKKFLYYMYPDVINNISSNERFHSTLTHNIGVSIDEDAFNYTISFNFKNKTNEEKQFFYTIHSDDGSSKQRFSVQEEKEYLVLQGGVDTIIVKTIAIPPSNDLIAVTSNVIKEYSPFNAYLWSREHILDDAISTIAGLNINLDILSGGEVSAIKTNVYNNVICRKFFFNSNHIVRIPQGNWELTVYDLTGLILYKESNLSSRVINLNDLPLNMGKGIGIFKLKQL